MRLPDRPTALTRDETIDLMTAAGYRDIEMRSTPDLEPVDPSDWVVVFLGRKPA